MTDLSTAKASFVSALLPSDRHAPHLTQQSALTLVRQLNRTTNICTSRNIQQCKRCIITYILPSPARMVALSRYLLLLSKSCRPRPADFSLVERATGSDDGLEGLDFTSGQMLAPRSAARRLHLVYMIHDILLTVHAWRTVEEIPTRMQHLDLENVLSRLTKMIISLVRLAACRGEYRGDEVSQALSKLVAGWKTTSAFTEEELGTLDSVVGSCRERTWEQALEESAREDDQRAADERKAREEAHKWLLPRRHGVKDDPESPWYELPAANGLYMRSLRGFPLRAGAFPRGGFELKYGGQEADSDLQKDVSWLHSEMLQCFESYTEPEDIQDIDTLGNRVWKNPERPTRNYWGFTYDGIEKAKENSRKFRESATGYHDIAPLMPQSGSVDEVDTAIARARALAGGRGGFETRGGRGRGGRGGGGQWRGPPRGGNGYRDGRGGGPPGRYY